MRQAAESKNGRAEKRFLTRREVAEITGLSERTLAKWALLGQGPQYKILGGACRYEVADLEAWIAAAPVRGGQVTA